MRDLLRSSLARSLHTLPEEDRLAAALPVVCGTALAAHCAVNSLDEDRVLHLQVRGREWLGPLLAMREVLQHDLARIAGVALTGLHFSAPRPERLAEAKAEPASVPPAEVPGSVAKRVERNSTHRTRSLL